MFQNNTWLIHAALERSQSRQQGVEGWAVRAALRLYQQARNRGWLRRIGSAITGRSRCLFDLNAVKPTHAIHGCQRSGTQAVPIARIRGSEGRCSDFDSAFNPLQSHNKDRWLSVAMARQMGVALPPVELIRVGGIYFVRDGHHRISVAQALGQKDIDAVVTVWHVTGPLPWERVTVSASMKRQPA